MRETILPQSTLASAIQGSQPPVLGSVSALMPRSIGPKTPRKRPCKLWELHSRYHCPIIGTCIDMDELRKLLRQGGVEIEQSSEYELHGILVGHADSQNRLSKLLQKYLEKKYTAHRKRFAAAKTPEGLLGFWREAWKIGDIAGAFWAVLTHPLVNEEIRYEVYGQVHMLSHQMGSLQRADLNKLHRLQQRELELMAQVNELWKTGREREKQLLDLRQENQALRRKPTAVENTRDGQTARLRQQLQQAEQAQARLRERFETAVGQNHAQQIQIDQLEARLELEHGEREVLEQHLTSLLAPCQDCDQACQAPEMRGQKVLYVGGRDKLKPHFRALVEQQYGGEFVHHDGGLHGKESCLAQMLCQADFVFCPVDCISHNACNLVKQHCKKNNKPMVLLRTESLSAFTRGLRDALVEMPLAN